MKQAAGILFFLVLFFSEGFSQSCPQVGTSPDVTLCKGDTVQISAYHPSYTEYFWIPSTGISATTIANPLVFPAITTTYTVTALEFGSNLITNGDFSLGNTGFTSDHVYSSTYAPCNYYIGTTFFNYYDPTYKDHTSTNDNLYMSIDGCSTPAIIWEQQITVIPNTDYKFGFWATRAAVAQPVLETSFTGNVTGLQVMSTQTGLPSYNNYWHWDAFDSPVWNSGSNTQVTIKVRNLETATGGVDFGLDDFSFRRVCSSTSSLTVTVTPDPLLDLGPDFGLCSSSSVTIDAGANFKSYQWNNGNTGRYLTITSPGTYWVNAISACGTVHTDSVKVFVTPPLSVDLGGNKTICQGEAVHFSLGQFNSYSWTGNGLSCNNCANPTATPLISGAYQVTVMNAQDCTATDSIWITVNPLPVLDLGNDLYICIGDSVRLSSPAGFINYQWSGSNLNCVTCPFPWATPTVSSNYTLTAVTSQGCTTTDNVRVNVFSLPSLELGEDITICKGEQTQFLHLPQAASYSWTPALGLSCNNCANPKVSPSDSTQYFLTITNVHGCITKDSIHVFVRDDAPQHIVFWVDDATCEHGGTVVIEVVGNETGELQYNFAQQGFSSTPLYTSVPPGNYLVSVRNGSDGCPYSDVAVVDGEYNSLFIPNAFTPDGSEFNNTWGIKGNCILEIKCLIYNRWGEEIATLNDLSQVWDGTYKGQAIPDGVYAYTIEVTYVSSQKERATGFITLLR